MSTSLQAEFEAAQKHIKEAKTEPSDDVLLQIYSLYKQATLG